MIRGSDFDLSEVPDEVLCGAAALGDREAFEVLVARYGPPLYRYGRRMLSIEADVADVVQETFLAVWCHLGSFAGRSSLRTWIFAICSRKIADTRRIRVAEPIDDRLLEALPEDAGLSDPFAVASNAAFLAALEEALAELPARQRATWVMHDIEHMTFPEIGAALSLSPNAVRGHQHRATATLRLRLRRWQ